MDNEPEVIRQEMEETRTALQDKLETLEQHVKDTLSNATDAVNETVSTVKEAVHDTVDSVKESVSETVDSVKETFDVRQQVEKHPWPMFLGAAVVGFIGARLLDRMLRPSPAHFAPQPFLPPYSAPRMQAESPALPPPAPQPGLLDNLAETFHDELTQIKGLAIGTVGGLVREMLTQAVPPPMVEQVKEVVDSVTTKLGGHPFEEPIIDLSSGSSEFKPDGSGNGRHQKVTAS